MFSVMRRGSMLFYLVTPDFELTNVRKSHNCTRHAIALSTTCFAQLVGWTESSANLNGLQTGARDG